MKNFEINLETKGTAAQNTLVAAMLEWWMASDKNDALRQIAEKPGEDLAGISNSVFAGLNKLAEIAGCPAENLISECDLNPLKDVTSFDIIEALDAIHGQWIEDNFTARRWAEKYFKGQLPQYRKTAKIGFSEAKKDLLFIQEYFVKAGNPINIEEIELAYRTYATSNAVNDDVTGIATRAMKFAPEIIDRIRDFREKSSNKPQLVQQIDGFLADHTDPQQIMLTMIDACCE